MAHVPPKQHPSTIRVGIVRPQVSIRGHNRPQRLWDYIKVRDSSIMVASLAGCFAFVVARLLLRDFLLPGGNFLLGWDVTAELLQALATQIFYYASARRQQ